MKEEQILEAEEIEKVVTEESQGDSENAVEPSGGTLPMEETVVSVMP